MLTAQENIVSRVHDCGAAPFLIAASKPDQRVSAVLSAFSVLAQEAIYGVRCKHRLGKTRLSSS